VRRVRLSLFMATIMLRKLAPRLRLSRYLCHADQRDELAPPHLLPPRLNTRHRTNTHLQSGRNQPISALGH
jgi:hypothetical protein